MVRVKRSVTVRKPPPQSYGTSSPIIEAHTVWPATRHGECDPPNTSQVSWYSIYLPRRDGRLSWPSLVVESLSMWLCEQASVQSLVAHDLYRHLAWWPHHSWSQMTSLSAGETACQLQAGYRALNNIAAQYLVDDCQLVSNTGRCWLWLADVITCIVPHTRTHLGDRSSSVAGTQLWNSLPVELCQSHVEIEQFRQLLKTFWFEYDCGE